MQIERLRGLLAERGPVPAGDLPSFPFTNATQVFHAQAQYIVSEDIQGLRFLTQHAQDVRPVSSQELFYALQGFTADGAYYVTAFFPVDTAALPERLEGAAVEEWEVFSANFDACLLETRDALDQLTPADFTPDLTLLDAVVTSLQVEPEDATFGQEANPSACDGSRWRDGGSGIRLLLGEDGLYHPKQPAPDWAINRQ